MSKFKEKEEAGSLLNNTLKTEIDLIDLLMPVLKNIKIVILLPLIGTILFALIYYFLAPKTYASSADLVVLPPKFKTEFQESNLTVQFFKNLLESKALISKLKIEGVKKHLLNKSDDLEIGKDIEVKIFTKKREEDITLSPIVRLIVYADNPEKAYNLLKIWIKIFMQEVEDIQFKAKKEAITFVDTEFSRKKKEYEQTIKQYNDLKNEFEHAKNLKKLEMQKELNKMNTYIMKTLNEFDKERANKRLELTKKRKEGLKNLKFKRAALKNKLLKELKPEVTQAEFEKISEKYKNDLAKLKVIDQTLAEKEKILSDSLKLLKETPEKIELKEKGLLFSRKNEKLNENYLELTKKIQDLKHHISILKAQKTVIQKNIGNLQKEYDKYLQLTNENNKKIEDFDNETQNLLDTYKIETQNLLNAFDNETKYKRKQLENKLNLEKQKLQNKLNEELAQLKANYNVKLVALENKKTYLGNIYRMLTDKYEKASLSKTEEESPIKIAVEPYIPIEPEKKRTLEKTLIFGFLLLVLVIFGVYIKETYSAYIYRKRGQIGEQ